MTMKFLQVIRVTKYLKLTYSLRCLYCHLSSKVLYLFLPCILILITFYLAYQDLHCFDSLLILPDRFSTHFEQSQYQYCPLIGSQKIHGAATFHALVGCYQCLGVLKAPIPCPSHQVPVTQVIAADFLATSSFLSLVFRKSDLD